MGNLKGDILHISITTVCEDACVCVCVCGKWREWCMTLSLSMVWSVTCHMLCIENGGVQCVIEHGVERHLPYVVCVCVENGGSGA